MRLLDLFCGAGGAAMGYHRAGFEVVGVDHKPQPRYPFEFHCEDAFVFLEKHGHEFDVIHASPPCQAYSSMSRKEHRHPDLYVRTRDRLEDLGNPWIIENVIGAPYRYGLLLCGSMFQLPIRRHRIFETRDLILSPLRCAHFEQGRPITITGNGGGKPGPHSWKGIKKEWPCYMEMQWATPEECTQAVPPAYTEWIGVTMLKGWGPIGHERDGACPLTEVTMDLTPENKAHIDGLSYFELLRGVRFSPVGNPWFQGETGDYWLKHMTELREKGADHVGASKALGWER